MSIDPNFASAWEDDDCLPPGWHRVEIPRSGLTNEIYGAQAVPYILNTRRELIRVWCEENCTEHYDEESILTYIFENREDSVLFALTWC